MAHQIKENPMKYEQYKLNKQYRKLQNKENKAVKVEEADQAMFHRSLSRAGNDLPKSLHKKQNSLLNWLKSTMWKFLSMRKVADLGEILTRKKNNGLFLSCTDASYTSPEGKTMYVLATLMVNVAISNLCVCYGIYAIFCTL